MESRGGHLAHPRVVFILGQPALHQRGLEDTDHLLAVHAVGGAFRQTATALGACRHLVSRLGRHRCLPRATERAMTRCPYRPAPGADRGGCCPLDRFPRREATTMDTPRTQKMA